MGKSKQPPPHQMKKSTFFAPDSSGKASNDINKFPNTARYAPLAKSDKQMFEYLKLEKTFKEKNDTLTDKKREQLANFKIRPGAEKEDLARKKDLETKLKAEQDKLKGKAAKKAKIIYKKDGLESAFNRVSKKPKTQDRERTRT